MNVSNKASIIFELGIPSDMIANGSWPPPSPRPDGGNDIEYVCVWVCRCAASGPAKKSTDIPHTNVMKNESAQSDT